MKNIKKAVVSMILIFIISMLFSMNSCYADVSLLKQFNGERW